jgi:hypothetical protein
LVTDVIANLLETAKRWEIADGIREDGMALDRQTGGKAGHVLLRNADIQELVREMSDEVIQHTKTEITSEE